MNAEKLNQWLGIGANLGVLIGIYFLVIEIGTNTESNTIGLQSAYTSNFVQINTLFASEETSSLIDKAASNEELSSAEERQLYYLVNLVQTQSNFMRRLWERGIATDEEFINAYNGYRDFAQEVSLVRELVLQRSERTQQLVLEDDGVEKYIRSVRESQ